MANYSSLNPLSITIYFIRMETARNTRSHSNLDQVFLPATDVNRQKYKPVVGLTSHVWQYFDRNVEDHTSVVCHLCNQLLFVRRSTTGPMVSHLQKNHDIKNPSKGNQQIQKSHRPPEENEIQTVTRSHSKLPTPSKNHIAVSGTVGKKIQSKSFEQDINPMEQGRKKKRMSTNPAKTIPGSLNLLFRAQIQSQTPPNQISEINNAQLDLQGVEVRAEQAEALKTIPIRDGNIAEVPSIKTQQRGVAKKQFEQNSLIRRQINVEVPVNSDYRPNPSNLENKKPNFMDKSNSNEEKQRKKLRGPRGPYRRNGAPINAQRNRKYFSRLVKRNQNNPLFIQAAQNKIKMPHLVLPAKDNNNQPPYQRSILQSCNEQEMFDSIVSKSYLLDTISLILQLSSQLGLQEGMLRPLLKKYYWGVFSDRQFYQDIGICCPKNLIVKYSPSDNTQRAENIFPIPNWTVVVSQNMIRNYNQFGSVVRLAEFEHPVCSMDKDSRVIYLMGQNNFLNSVMFGIILLKSQDDENYQGAFDSFFDIVSGHLPNVIIKQRNLKRGYLIPSYFHQLSEISNVKLIETCNIDKLIRLTDVLEKRMKKHSKNREQIRAAKQILYQIVNENSSDNIQQLKQLFIKASGVNLRLNREMSTQNREANFHWVGMSLEITKAIKMRNTLASPYRCDCVTKFLQHAFRVQNKLLQAQRKTQSNSQDERSSIRQYEQVLDILGLNLDIFDDNDELIQIQGYLSPPLYQIFLLNYMTAIQSILIKEEPRDSRQYLAVFQQKQPQFSNQNDDHIQHQLKIYSVRYSVHQECWNCNCGYQYTMGLPCPHIIRVLLLWRGSLRYYIHKSWLIGKKQRSSEKMSRSLSFLMEVATERARRHWNPVTFANEIEFSRQIQLINS